MRSIAWIRTPHQLVRSTPRLVLQCIPDYFLGTPNALIWNSEQIYLGNACGATLLGILTNNQLSG